MRRFASSGGCKQKKISLAKIAKTAKVRIRGPELQFDSEFLFSSLAVLAILARDILNLFLAALPAGSCPSSSETGAAERRPWRESGAGRALVGLAVRITPLWPSARTSS